MRDTEAPLPPDSSHPPNVYLPDDGVTDYLIGTPSASNRAEHPLVSLQPKTTNKQQQPSAVSNAPTTNAANSRAPSSAIPSRLNSQAGRGHQRKHDTLRLVNATSDKPPALNSQPATSNDDGYTLVQPKKHKIRGGQVGQDDMQVSGLLLSRVGQKMELEKQPIPFSDMLQALISIDPNIMIFPYNCAVENIHKASNLLKRSQDYKSLMDITLVNWGSPSEGKGKLAFSFYIGSTIIGEDLQAVKQSKQFQKFLSQSKFKVTPHYLHQTESKPLAFFSGKSPTHTWRQDLRERFQEYLNHYLKDPNAISNLFGEYQHVPTTIPFFLKISKIRTKHTTATAVLVDVGKTHHADATTLLKTAPFEDIEMVLIGNHQRDQAVYDKQIQVHQWLCQKSTAVKLRYTTEMFRSAMRIEAKANDTLKKAIIDVAEASSTRSEGTLYIQCLAKHKATVTEFAENFIAAFNTQHPDECEAEVVHHQGSRNTNASVSPNQTINTWSRWQDDMDEDISFTTNQSKTSLHRVPGTIETSHSLSYASIVAGHHHSNISSPTASRTGTHSLRVNELELENERLRSRLQEFEGSQQSVSTSSKSSSKSKREIELEKEVHQVKSQLAQQMEKFNSLEHKFEMLLRHLQPQDHQHAQTNPTPRKRKSDKHLFKNNGGRRIHSSNAGSTNPTSDPPDPRTSNNPNVMDNQCHREINPSATHRQTTASPAPIPTILETGDTTLEGGIADDDLSEQMIQDWEDSTSNSKESAMSDSPEASRKKND